MGEVRASRISSRRAKYKVTATWIDSLGTKHDFVKTDVTFPCTSNSYGMECSVTSEQPYDYLTIDSTGSEFEQLKTGNYFGASATPEAPRVTFKNGTVFTVTERILGCRISAAQGVHRRFTAKPEHFVPAFDAGRR